MATKQFSLNTDNLSDGWTQREIESAVEGLRASLRNHDFLTISGPITVSYEPSTKTFTFDADVEPSDIHPHTHFGLAFKADLS